ATHVDAGLHAVRTAEPRHVVDVLERRIALRRLGADPRHHRDTGECRLRYSPWRLRIERSEPAGEAVDPELRLVHQVRSQDSDVGCDEALGANRHVLPLPGQGSREHDVLWTVDERVLDVVPRVEAVAI